MESRAELYNVKQLLADVKSCNPDLLILKRADEVDSSHNTKSNQIQGELSREQDSSSHSVCQTNPN